MEVAERIRTRGPSLTAAERRIAEVILASPQVVGFGTVAELAGAANAGTATVVRLATKLGYEGYSELQGAVQRDLMGQLRPAAERIHQRAGGGIVARHRTVQLSNVERTLEAVDEAHLASLVTRLTDLARPVMVLSGDASDGVARQFVTDLSALRPDVDRLSGNSVAIRRQMATAGSDVSLLAIDLRRYDQWLLEVLADARSRRWWTAAFTDGYLSPLASAADVTFVLTAGSVGPFDSHVGTLALLDLVIAELADVLHDSAAQRLEQVERAWSSSGQLAER